MEKPELHQMIAEMMSNGMSAEDIYSALAEEVPARKPVQSAHGVSYAGKSYDDMTAEEKRHFWARAENDRLNGCAGLKIKPATVVDVRAPQVKNHNFSNHPVHKFLEHLD